MNSESQSGLMLEFIRELEHATPFFLISSNRIIANVERFKELFPGCSIYYAMKANSELDVLRTVAQASCGFEVASVPELQALQQLNVPSEKIIYGSAVKSACDISKFYEYGVCTYAFDSLSELEKIAATAPGSKVFVRIAVNDSDSVFKFSEKFGTAVENAPAMLEKAKELGLQPYGLSFHVGSQARDPNAWAAAIDSVAEAIRGCEKIGIEVQTLNLGGGFPCNYECAESAVDLRDIAQRTLERYEKLPCRPKIIIEPGRAIVANAAVLVTKVIARIERSRLNTTWLFLDAGVYNALFEAMAFQGAIRYRIEPLASWNGTNELPFGLAGPTGDGLDVITRQALLPESIGAGDRLIIRDVGAYSLALSSRFNGFARPAVYFI
jgi:ornithine decarboxylase